MMTKNKEIIFNMNLCKRTLVCAAFFVCVLFLSCEKKDTVIMPEVPAGTPVFTEQPKSATYLEDERREMLAVFATAGKDYNISYQWYSMQYVKNHSYTAANEREILVEVDKLINNDTEGSQFRKLGGYTDPGCNAFSYLGQTVYICIVTSTSSDGSETFTAVSDTAVIKIIQHPLTDWYAVDKNLFIFSTYNGSFMHLNDVTYGNGYFVAVGEAGSYNDPHGIIAYSNDGITWNHADPDRKYSLKNRLKAIAYGNDRFVVAGAKGIIAYSNDIKTWIPVESAVSEDFKDIVYGNGLFIANFRSGLVYSDNGETWLAAENLDTENISCIAYGNGRFIAGDRGGRIFFSDNGKKWTTLNGDMFNSHYINTISYCNGRFLALACKYIDHPSRGDEKDSYIMGFSDDGKTWSTHIPYTISGNDINWNEIEDIVYREGYFIAIGSYTALSKDGVNWDYFGRRSSYYNAIVYNGGYFVAVGGSGTVEYCQYPVTKALAPIITEQPIWRKAYSIKDQGYISDLRVRYASFGEHSFQWYRNNTDNTDTGTAIEGADRRDYAPDVSKASTIYYYVKVTNTIPEYFKVDDKNRSASVTSETVAITVDFPEETAIK
jgi:hypothetical protein